MQAASVSKEIRDHYGAAYTGTSEWRWLGAIDKAKNIVQLCAPYPHKTLLEIGAGEGSVLKRLSDLRFGDSLYALEISSSAVQAIRQRHIPDRVECSEFDGYNIPYSDTAYQRNGQAEGGDQK